MGGGGDFTCSPRRRWLSEGSSRIRTWPAGAVLSSSAAMVPMGRARAARGRRLFASQRGADLSYTLKYPESHRATFGDPGVARGGRRELRRPRGRTCQNLRGPEGVNTPNDPHEPSPTARQRGDPRYDSESPLNLHRNIS